MSPLSTICMSVKFRPRSLLFGCSVLAVLVLDSCNPEHSVRALTPSVPRPHATPPQHLSPMLPATNSWLQCLEPNANHATLESWTPLPLLSSSALIRGHWSPACRCVASLLACSFPPRGKGGSPRGRIEVAAGGALRLYHTCRGVAACVSGTISPGRAPGAYGMHITILPTCRVVSCFWNNV